MTYLSIVLYYNSMYLDIAITWFFIFYFSGATIQHTDSVCELKFDHDGIHKLDTWVWIDRLLEVVWIPPISILLNALTGLVQQRRRLHHLKLWLNCWKLSVMQSEDGQRIEVNEYIRTRSRTMRYVESMLNLAQPFIAKTWSWFLSTFAVFRLCEK